MRFIILTLGLTGVIGLTAASFTMNWQFGHGLGQTDLNKHILGTSVASLDLIKIALPFAIFWAFRRRNISLGLIGCILFVGCFVVSIASSVGFSSTNRSAFFGAEEAKQAVTSSYLNTVKDGQEELNHLRKQLAGKLHWRDRREKLKRVTAIENNIADATKSLSFSIGNKTIVRVINPQAQFFSDLSGYDVRTIELAIVVIMALVFELAASFSAYTILRPFLHGKVHKCSEIEISPPPPNTSVQNKENVVSLPKNVSEISAVRSFLNQRTQSSQGSVTGATVLHQAYQKYAPDFGFPDLSQRKFGLILKQLGLEKGRKAPGGAIAYLNLYLAA